MAFQVNELLNLRAFTGISVIESITICRGANPLCLFDLVEPFIRALAAQPEASASSPSPAAMTP